MSDQDISRMDDQTFDRFLQDAAGAPPSGTGDIITPWGRAMKQILWGVGLTTLTLQFFNLDIFLPGIGRLLMFLGFRSLHRENGWFRMGRITSGIRLVWWLVMLFVNVAVYCGGESVESLLTAVNIALLAVDFLSLVAVVGGIRAVRRKAGLSPGGGYGILIWYLIILALGLVNFTGISVWGLLIAYGFILRKLWRLSRELKEAGYCVEAAPLKVSDRCVGAICCGVMLVLLAVGYGFCSKYPLDWKPVQTSSGAQQVRQELLALGFPQEVLADMTEAEVLRCQGATMVLVDSRDYDLEQGRGIGTQEEINDGKVALITDEKGQRQLRNTFIGVKLGEGRERWMIIHHFRWLIQEDFCGTEALELVSAARKDAWAMGEAGLGGRVLYDRAGQTYGAEFFSIQPGSDPYVYVNFSYPRGIENARGYVLYDIWEQRPGCIVDSWCNYVHQHSLLQFPVQTAMENARAWDFLCTAFRKVEDALQFYAHREVPELL